MMALLDLLRQRNATPSVAEAQRMLAGNNEPSMRGVMPWNSGFGPYFQGNILPELLKALKLRAAAQKSSTDQYSHLPLAPWNRR